MEIKKGSDQCRKYFHTPTLPRYISFKRLQFAIQVATWRNQFLWHYFSQRITDFRSSTFKGTQKDVLAKIKDVIRLNFLEFSCNAWHISRNQLVAVVFIYLCTQHTTHSEKYNKTEVHRHCKCVCILGFFPEFLRQDKLYIWRNV